MIFCSKFIKTITSSALLAGVASSSFVSAYDTKLRRGISCDEDKDISSRDSKLKALTKKDVTNSDDENLFEDDELDNDEDNRRAHKDNISHGSSYEDTDSVDKVPIVNKHETEISKLKDNKSSSESDLLKSLDFKTVASIISTSSSIGILESNNDPDSYKKEEKKDEPEPHIKDDDKNKDNPDPRKKEEKNDEPVPSPVTPGNENSNKKYIWITLGVFGFVVLAVIFFYRKKFRRSLSRFVAAMCMKCFGVDKFVKNYDILSYNYDECKGLFKKILSNNDFQAWSNAYECTQYMKKNGPLKYLDYFRNDAYAQNNWKEVYKNVFGKDIDYDIAEKLLYRHKHDYKKYIENYPNNWWKLYTEDYLKFLEADSEEMNYVVSLILEIYYKNPNLYLNSVYEFAGEILDHATNYCMFWFSKLAREDEAAESVELSQDGHFLVKDKKTGNTVTFKYLNSFLKLAKEFPISGFNDRLSDMQIPEYEKSHVFFTYFLYIDDPDDSFINIMLIPDSEISEKANEAISSLGILVSKLDSINFENSVKEKLFLNFNKLLNYFKNILVYHEEFKTYIEKNLTYDEANNILKAVKSKIENNNNNNNNNNIPKIDSQANNCLN